jgi:hypothetical protein
MDENWYAAEQEVRDRIAEARAAARLRTLTRGLRPEVRRPRFVRAAVTRFVSWVLTRAVELSSATSRGVANPQAVTKRGRR